MPDKPQNNKKDEKTIPMLEEEILKFWQENKIFEKSVEKNPKDNLYVFYDGPPFISGLPHYGHILGSIAKDVIPRYWTMKGKRVERVWGWDAHGLPVENKVQQRLGIKNRRDVEQFGLKKFTEECYAYTSEISSKWQWYVDRIGRWVDMDNAYKTTDQNYMESVIWAFKQLYDKGLIYEGVRTSLFCTVCGTPVSNFEVAMDNSYKDMEDPSVTIKFEITTGKWSGSYLLAWTTTPWTLPSNRALVVDDKEQYVLLESRGEEYILAEKRVGTIFKDREYTVLEKILGKDLIGLSYKPLFTFYTQTEKEFKVYTYENMVTMEEGTGIVHSAPGFGEIDTEMGRHYGLTIMMSIDDEGKFTPGDQGENPYAGVYYKKADPLILDDLSSRNLLFANEKIVHRFPYHDRCDTPLIQRAQKSWFININKFKDQLLATNENINWIPSYFKEGRFKQGIEQAPDWCISRNRFWATPMPVWESSDGDRIIISSVKELEELSGQKVTDLHRPFIDEIVIKKDGKTYTRVSEVLDCWMESGSMPYAQMHYPFENKEKFEKNFPGDYISEYVGQARAWFYVMHVLSTMIFGRNAFKNVIVSGVMAGSDGRKMSKTYNNFTDPKEVLTNYGGDALRLYLMGSPLMLAESANFDEEELKTKLRNVINPLWNSTKYFLIYAKEHNWSEKKITLSEDILDKWIMSRLHETIREIGQNLESYLVPPAVRAIETFVDDLSRWYVRRSREKISGGDDKSLSTLFTVLQKFSQAAAPIIPFISESIHQELRPYSNNDLPESVHLCSYPEYEEDFISTNKGINDNMKKVRELSSIILSLRVEKGVGVRQPLEDVVLHQEQKLSKEYENILLEEVNVKNINYSDSPDVNYVSDTSHKVAVNFTISEELKLEGHLRDFIRKIQDLRKKAEMTVSEPINLVYEDNEINRTIIKLFGTGIKKKVNAKNIEAGSENQIRKAVSN